MRRRIVLALAALSLAGCISHQYGVERQRRFDLGEETEEGITDTLPPDNYHIYVSAVSMDGDYDWRRDTAMGMAPGRLLLFRDTLLLLSLETGREERISPDHDMHHIIGGHLITEYSTSDSTFVKCDGEPLLEYPGRELLLGLIFSGGSWYSLGRSRDGAEFSFRRDGVPVFTRSSCVVRYSFGGDNFGEGGALFEEEGEVCFFYETGAGEERFVKGAVEEPASERSEFIREKHLKVRSDGRHIYYYGRGRAWTVSPSNNGVIYVSGQKQVQLGNNLYFFSTQCAHVAGDDIYLALTSRDSYVTCFCWDSRTREMRALDINGYLTGISHTD